MFAKRYKPSIGDSIEELIEFLKYVPEEDLIEFSMQVFKESGHEENIVWWPIIEGHFWKIYQKFRDIIFKNDKFFSQTKMQFNHF